MCLLREVAAGSGQRGRPRDPRLQLSGLRSRGLQARDPKVKSCVFQILLPPPISNPFGRQHGLDPRHLLRFRNPERLAQVRGGEDSILVLAKIIFGLFSFVPPPPTGLLSGAQGEKDAGRHTRTPDCCALRTCNQAQLLPGMSLCVCS